MNPRPIASCSLLGAFALVAVACNTDAERTSPTAPAAANARAEFDLGKPA